MGKNNQQRRAAKKRRRGRASPSSGPPPGRRRSEEPSSRGHHRADGPGAPPPPPTPDELVWAAVTEWDTATFRFDRILDVLVEMPAAARAAAQAHLDTALDQAWARGWAPTDVLHAVGRRFSAGHVEVTAARLVADGRRRTARGQHLPPAWQRQLDDLGERDRSAAPSRPEEAIRLLVQVVSMLVRLAEVPPTIPRPGQTSAGAPSNSAQLDSRMLGRVRALLAKAESTEFEEEAEAFTAKAQELIARHAIDEAMLHTVDDIGDPSVRRLLLDDPYVEAKAMLVAEVAGANRCRAVYGAGSGWVTLFGYDHDLDAVELLTASLLTQATSAMVRHGSRRDASGRSTTRSFRRAFLVGFAQRIGERLRAATDHEMSATTGDRSRLVPVLAARDDRLQAAERAAFPNLVHRSTSISNGSGFHAGQAAAEQATLQVSPHHVTAR